MKYSQTNSPENNMIQQELFLISAEISKVKLSKAHINIRIIRIFIRIWVLKNKNKSEFELLHLWSACFYIHWESCFFGCYLLVDLLNSIKKSMGSYIPSICNIMDHNLKDHTWVNNLHMETKECHLKETKEWHTLELPLIAHILPLPHIWANRHKASTTTQPHNLPTNITPNQPTLKNE